MMDIVNKRGKRAGQMLALSLLLGWCAGASALDPALDISQYAHTAWKNREGFAKGIVHETVQSPDGYLWVATEAGLIRFDGVHPFFWQPPAGEHLPSNDIRSIAAGKDGTLWIGTAKGLVSWKDGKLIHYPELDGYDIYTLLADHEGTAWVGAVRWERSLTAPGRFCRARPGNIQCYGSDGLLDFGVTAMYEDRRGNLWLGAANGLWRWKPGPPQRFPMPDQAHGGPPHLIFNRHAITEDGRGGLLIVGLDRIERFSGGKFELWKVIDGTPQTKDPKLFWDRDGSLWIGSQDAGLIHVHQGRLDVYMQADGLSDDHIEGLFEDHEGNVWISTSGGIDRFREYAVASLGTRQGLASTQAASVMTARDGSIWVGTTYGLDRWKDGAITLFRQPTGRSGPGNGGENPASVLAGERLHGTVVAHVGPAIAFVPSPELPNDFVCSTYQDKQGRIWISTWSGLAYVDNGRVFRPNPPTALPGNQLVGDRAGNLWTAVGDRGLIRLREGKVVEVIPWAKLGIEGALSNPLAADPVGGGLWVGSWNGGLVYFKDGQVKAAFGSKEGLGTGRVNSVKIDSEGIVWVATDGGLSRISNGRIVTLTSKNGLPCDNTQDLVEDDAHSLWVVTSCALVRIARNELREWGVNTQRKVEVTVFDTADGVRSHAGTGGCGPRSTKARDGKLWFAPFDWAMVVDPRHLPANPLPPPVHIEQITADRRPYSSRNRLRLPPLVRDLAIDFTALSFAAPEKVRFRFMLEGQDEDWREGSERRVEYSNLRPRHYRFRVLACNNSGVWNQEGDSLDFNIPPAWYQTNWFYAICAATFLLLLWGLYHLRVLQLRREFNVALEARVGERTRVARDIHDTLLQSFQALLPLFQVAIHKLPEGADDARNTLELALHRASHAVTEGRDAVQGLRNSTVEKNDLALTIETVGEKLASANASPSSPKFKVVVEGTSRDLHPILRDEIYRIAAEALRNAFRHAEARSVEVEIRYDAKYFQLRIRDDGKGIPDEILCREGREGHYGLPGMRERAALMGASLTIWTKVDGGTEIELVIPASKVYAKSPRRFWQMGKRSPTDMDVKVRAD